MGGGRREAPAREEFRKRCHGKPSLFQHPRNLFISRARMKAFADGFYRSAELFLRFRLIPALSSNCWKKPSHKITVTPAKSSSGISMAGTKGNGQNGKNVIACCEAN